MSTIFAVEVISTKQEVHRYTAVELRFKDNLFFIVQEPGKRPTPIDLSMVGGIRVIGLEARDRPILITGKN